LALEHILAKKYNIPPGVISVPAGVAGSVAGYFGGRELGRHLAKKEVAEIPPEQLEEMAAADYFYQLKKSNLKRMLERQRRKLEAGR